MNDVHLRLLLDLARNISHYHNSVGDFLLHIVHLELLAMSPLNDQVWVGSKPYVVVDQVGTYGKVLVGPNLHNWHMLVLEVLDPRHGTMGVLLASVLQKHSCVVLHLSSAYSRLNIAQHTNQNSGLVKESRLYSRGTS